MRKNEEDQGKLLLQCGKLILLGGLTAFLMCTVLLFLVSVGISEGLISMSLQYRLTVVICVLSSFLGGIMVVRQCPGRDLLVGIAVGAVLFLIQLSVGLVLYDTFSLENGGIGLLCGGLCGGAAAGILSGGGKGRTQRNTPKRRR
ncbi:MAG: TIGR04086 family membrane protein [Oscillospiraceae bacterium]|nr:TIGR04086 family membrane protein [Oscillospiraceae bacterium]